jgi:DNA gyrase/topoisomerase IV subunit B
MGVMEAACSLTELKEQDRQEDGRVEDQERSWHSKFHRCEQRRNGEVERVYADPLWGLSAMSGVVSGLSAADRNLIGIYALKGKIMNVRCENIKKYTTIKKFRNSKDSRSGERTRLQDDRGREQAFTL